MIFYTHYLDRKRAAKVDIICCHLKPESTSPRRAQSSGRVIKLNPIMKRSKVHVWRLTDSSQRPVRAEVIAEAVPVAEAGGRWLLMRWSWSASRSDSAITSSNTNEQHDSGIVTCLYPELNVVRTFISPLLSESLDSDP